MIQNVFAGILILIAIIAGIWCLWIEHGGEIRKEEMEDEEM